MRSNAAAALWRPEGPVGPYLRAAGALHRYFQEEAFNLATIDAGAQKPRACDRDVSFELTFCNL